MCAVQRSWPVCLEKDTWEAVRNAVVLEEVAKMVARCEQLNLQAKQISKELLDKHYFRMHGEGAYYGQKSNKRSGKSKK